MHAIPILYSSSDLLVVNKPSGIGMHDTPLDDAPFAPQKPLAANSNAMASAEDNAGDAVHKGFATQRKVIPGIVSLLKAQLGLSQLHLCHRLDTGTSGCLCLAKNESMAAEIGALFKTRAVSKYYLALSNSKPKKKQGTLIGDMKNRRGGQRILLKTTENPAITQFFSASSKPGVRGFVVKPHTGKTHQIRVALKSIGSPISGDTLYGGEKAERLNLHAWQLTLPLQSESLVVTAPINTTVALFEEEAFTLCDYKGGFADPEIQDWVSTLQPPDDFPWPNVPKRFGDEGKATTKERS